MKVFTKDSEVKLLELANGLKQEPGNYYALHFNLSQLNEQYRSPYQVKIAVNILNDLFSAHDSVAFTLADKDIIFIYNGTNRALLEKAIFQLRYIFMDDPLCYGADGLENDDFCNVYDLEFQWRDFFIACQKKSISGTSLVPQGVNTCSTEQLVLTLNKLVHIISDIQKKNISETLRIQPVCVITPNNGPKIIWDEVYINITHLCKILNIDVNIFSSLSLFKYMTQALDKKVLTSLKTKIAGRDRFSLSFNLNISTLFTEEFVSFDSELAPYKKPSTIIEIQVADVFENLPRFLMAKEAMQKLGYMICLDGLDYTAFTQIDRQSLGFDLIKIQWNAEGEQQKESLFHAVQKCDPRRVIFCRCDTEEAIEFGKSIGISLFQGRYIDKLIYPDAKLLN